MAVSKRTSVCGGSGGSEACRGCRWSGAGIPGGFALPCAETLIASVRLGDVSR